MPPERCPTMKCDGGHYDETAPQAESGDALARSSMNVKGSLMVYAWFFTGPDIKSNRMGSERLQCSFLKSALL